MESDTSASSRTATLSLATALSQPPSPSAPASPFPERLPRHRQWRQLPLEELQQKCPYAGKFGWLQERLADEETRRNTPNPPLADFLNQLNQSCPSRPAWTMTADGKKVSLDSPPKGPTIAFFTRSTEPGFPTWAAFGGDATVQIRLNQAICEQIVAFDAVGNQYITCKASTPEVPTYYYNLSLELSISGKSAYYHIYQLGIMPLPAPCIHLYTGAFQIAFLLEFVKEREGYCFCCEMPGDPLGLYGEWVKVYWSGLHSKPYQGQHIYYFQVSVERINSQEKVIRC